MMLSVLIVNYRVRYFLEHCLLSVLAAAEALQHTRADWQTEILVIDNDPPEGSLDALKPRFPSIQFFAAPENLGFGRANNYLLKESVGEYVLFLNPDTILPEDCFVKQISFLESKPAGAASGIRMIDGSGTYLPESKRGFPGLWTSFCKMAGLTGFFPSSSIFAGYYQGHLDPGRNQKVPVLSGAHMMVKTSALRKTGGFDEQFFMYAEDIDLSYRFVQSGFENFYFAETTIIHFKGESTRKDKKYIRQFYLAMIQFVRKHFSGASSRLLIRLLELAIRLKAGLSRARAETDVDSNTSSIRQAEQGTTATHTGTRIHTEKSVLSFLTGDPASIALCRQRYDHLRFTDLETESEQTIFCYGAGYSYADLIASVEASKASAKKIFHPLAMAIVGSNSKSRQGTAETFEN